MTLNVFPLQPELLGYCPVTFMDGKLRYEAIIPGSPELVVEYRRKFWFFVSPAHRDRCNMRGGVEGWRRQVMYLSKRYPD